MDQVFDAEGKVKWQNIDLGDIKREGKQIVLPGEPGPMSIDDAQAALERIKKAENTVYTVNEKVKGHFFDGLVAFTRAVKEIYGISQATHTTVQTLFGKMKEPPMMINVRTGPEPMDIIQVPFGSMKFPNIEGTIETGYGDDRGIPCLVLSGQVKAKERAIVLNLVKRANELVVEQSIYRGKSVIIERDERTKGIELDEPLQYFNPGLGNEVPIFNKDIEELIRTAVMAPLQFTKECRDNHIPLKRGILFEGPYGCGKSLVSREVAKTANANGWTFMLVKEAASLKYALNFARLYQPCVVFTEDIDRVVNDRNEKANSLLNDIDGVVGKNDEIIVVLTTNFAGAIDKAFLRPGRLDAVVSIRPPEAEAVERLVRYYAGPLLAEDADLKEACKMLAGNIPAQIREVVERSKLAMIAHGRTNIDGDEIKVSALSMQNHNELLAKASEGVKKTDSFDALVERITEKVLRENLNPQIMVKK